MSKFNIGDEVKPKLFSNGKIGKIISVVDSVMLYYIVEFKDNNDQPYTYSYEEDELIKVTYALIKCECGAQYTYAPDLHSFWCPKWRPNDEN